MIHLILRTNLSSQLNLRREQKEKRNRYRVQKEKYIWEIELFKFMPTTDSAPIYNIFREACGLPN